MRTSLVASLLSAVVLVAANNHGPARGSHHQLAKRASANSTETLEKRGSKRFSHYDSSVGLGACGKYNGPETYTVALNTPEFKSYVSYPGPQCGKSIHIEWTTPEGKTNSATAVIMDECPGCGSGGLDLTASLFTHISGRQANGPDDYGIIYGDWWYTDGTSDPEPEPTTTKKTTTKATPTPTPTSTWTPEPTPTSTWVAPTSTWTPEPETTSTWSSSSVWKAPKTSSSSKSKASSTSTWSAPATSSAKPTTSSVKPSTTSTSSSAAPSATGVQIFEEMTQALLDMAGLVAAGAAL